MKKLFVLMMLMVAQVTARAESFETNQMKDILRFLKPGTLVVFDIDNTILRTAQSLGSDQWFSSEVKSRIDQGMEESRAIDQVIPTWLRLQTKTQVLPVETVTPALIRYLQIHKVPVMALTARPLQAFSLTMRQLFDLKIDLRIGNNGQVYKNVGGSAEAGFANGVLFVGPKNNKGIILKNFLAERKVRPSRIIFTDDKAKHIENVGKSLQEAGIDYKGFRYGAADVFVKSYNPTVANRQLQIFLKTGQLVSDEQILGGSNGQKSLRSSVSGF